MTRGKEVFQGSILDPLPLASHGMNCFLNRQEESPYFFQRASSFLFSCLTYNSFIYPLTFLLQLLVRTEGFKNLPASQAASSADRDSIRRFSYMINVRQDHQFVQWHAPKNQLDCCCTVAETLWKPSRQAANHHQCCCDMKGRTPRFIFERHSSFKFLLT